jgi:23S rRNA (uridine2552-2'-O)-methyltransferase
MDYNRPMATKKPDDSGPASGARSVAVKLRKSQGRSTSQQAWLRRQLNDPYVTAARAQGLRSRAAFKLMELDDKYALIKKGARVIDLGAAPGGWTQVALKRGSARVVGIDLLPIDEIPGATLIEGDFNDPATPARLIELMGGTADLVLSDMAPNTTGHAPTDHLRIMALAELALAFALQTLSPGGAFVTKMFQGGTEKQMLAPMKLHFTSVRHAKPPASRKDSSELYVVATGFRKPPM